MNNVQIVVADTYAARRIHYRLRYQVFCLETGFEDASRYSDTQEKDEFDTRSVHFLARNIHSGAWLGTARLIQPCENLLPIQLHHQLNSTLDFSCTGEVSRLLICRGVRRRTEVPRSGTSRKSTKEVRSPYFLTSQNQRHIPSGLVLRGLILAIAGYCVNHGISRTAFFITPALARILRRLDIDLIEIGTPIRHRGLRIPYIVDANKVYTALNGDSNRSGSERHPGTPYRLFSELFNDPEGRRGTLHCEAGA